MRGKERSALGASMAECSLLASQHNTERRRLTDLAAAKKATARLRPPLGSSTHVSVTSKPSTRRPQPPLLPPLPPALPWRRRFPFFPTAAIVSGKPNPSLRRRPLLPRHRHRLRSCLRPSANLWPWPNPRPPPPPCRPPIRPYLFPPPPSPVISRTTFFADIHVCQLCRDNPAIFPPPSPVPIHADALHIALHSFLIPDFPLTVRAAFLLLQPPTKWLLTASLRSPSSPLCEMPFVCAQLLLYSMGLGPQPPPRTSLHFPRNPHSPHAPPCSSVRRRQ